tara:strand:+ start:1311 stop:1727 length:417 start_codon:yes stop_codon:yes gene_type:complete
MTKTRNRKRSRIKSRGRKRTRNRSGGRRTRNRSGGRRTRNRKRSRTRTRRRKRTRNRRRKRGGLYDKNTPLKERDTMDFNRAAPKYEGANTAKVIHDFKREANLTDHVNNTPNRGLRALEQSRRRARADRDPDNMQTR